MNALMIYPEFPDTFWSYKHALRFIGKKAAFPPLGLMTVSSLLPADWSRRLVDMNVRRLRDADIAWADTVFISGMTVQRDSAKAVIARCKAAGLTIVAGGPLFTMEPEDFPEVDHLVLDEAETSLPPFLEDLADGRAVRIYRADGFPELTASPTPDWSLIDAGRYHSMAIQYSRGCPFDCDFCNITSLLGHRVRTKSTTQVVTELDGLYANGWRGNVFFVDDNFIGNRRQLKTDLLPGLTAWRETRKRITFQTEASINLADDGELMAQMVVSGFNTVFVGIETPDEAALAECHKKQNASRDLVADVKRIQRAGLQVQGGFIVGFDSDNASVFRRQIDFIQRSGIVTAMVGLLQAPVGTKLYDRMQQEGRLRGSGSGDNTSGLTNIVPVMDLEHLQQGYHDILGHIYAPRHYYRRIRTFLREYRPPRRACLVTHTDVVAFLRSIYRLGIVGRERLEYWRLLAWACFRRPTSFPLAVQLAICGYHYRKVCELHVV